MPVNSGEESEQGSTTVSVPRRISIRSSEEPGVAIPEREYNRLIERVESLRPTGRDDLWATCAGAGVGVASAALVTVLSLTTVASSDTKAILWMLAIAGAAVAALASVASRTPRRDRRKEVDDLKKDMEMYRKHLQ